MLGGKLALVTGAGSGIGRAVCRVFSKEGATVVAADRNCENAEETTKYLQGSNHIPMSLDVSDVKSIEETFKIILDHYKRPPTIVVNSAGITRDNFLLKLTEHDFSEVLNVNLTGTFLVIQNAVKSMIDCNVSHGSSIINLSSIIGKIGNIGQSNYSASKAGVVALTKSASMEFGKFGIRVNAVLPGFVDTPMIQTVPDNVKQMFIKRIPLGRMGTAEEIAETILFLASDRSSYINGTTIEVTGGLC